VRAGPVVEVTFSRRRRKGGPGYRWLDAHHMVNGDGEVIEVRHKEHRGEDVDSVRRSVRRLRGLINANFEGGLNELFITLTYAENVRDVERVYRDFKRFYMRLKRALAVELKYIACIEPQMRGAWHLHVLLKRVDEEVLYIRNDECAEWWGQGFVRVQRLSGVDNVGAYLSAYLTDLRGEGIEAKGGRLCLYPPGVNIYRYSRNCAKPDLRHERYDEVKRALPDRPVWRGAYEVTRDGEVVNKVIYEQYNIKRA